MVLCATETLRLAIMSARSRHESLYWRYQRTDDAHLANRERDDAERIRRGEDHSHEDASRALSPNAHRGVRRTLDARNDSHPDPAHRAPACPRRRRSPRRLA